MDIEKIAAAFLNRRAWLEGHRRKTYPTDEEYEKAVFTDAEAVKNALWALAESGFPITGEGKNIIYGPLLSSLAKTGCEKTISELCKAGWTAVDTVCPRRAKIAFLIE